MSLLLQQRGTDVTARDADGVTPLQSAARVGDATLLTTLLDAPGCRYGGDADVTWCDVITDLRGVVQQGACLSPWLVCTRGKNQPGSWDSFLNVPSLRHCSRHHTSTCVTSAW